MVTVGVVTVGLGAVVVVALTGVLVVVLLLVVGVGTPEALWPEPW